MRRALLLLILLGTASPVRAHVGSPNVLYDGDAGPYPVRVVIRPPAVIPADAEVTVRLREGHTADEVTLQPVLLNAGLKGAPPPNAAEPVPGAPGVWSGRFLLMRDGSWSVRIHVKGSLGEGTAEVPLPAVRSRISAMSQRLGAFLAGLGLFLFAGAVSIIAAAVREASLPAGEKATGRRVAGARAVAALAAVLLALLVWGGKIWWDRSEGQLRQRLFKPFELLAATRVEAGHLLLSLTIEDPGTRHWSPLIPDHGKLMHLFLLREPGLDAFAHLHPVAQGQKDFLAALPPLPAGTYRVYADIVDEDGFPQTLVGQVKIPATPKAEAAGAQGGAAAPAPDADDSWRAAEPLSRAAAAGPRISPLDEGGTMLWRQEPLMANRETTLRFEVRGPDGRPLPLEPYMTMAGHAVITRDDGEVFVHLHPMGTVSMAAQEVFAHAEGRPAMPAMPGMPGMNHSTHSMSAGAGNVLSFPYEFPRPGRYRLWVQVKSAGRVKTGVFDAVVGEKSFL